MIIGLQWCTSTVFLLSVSTARVTFEPKLELRMRDKVATGLSILALVSVALLYLRVNQLQVEQHIHQSKDDEEAYIAMNEVSTPPIKESAHRMARNSHGIETDKSTTLREEKQMSTSKTVNSKSSSKDLAVSKTHDSLIPPITKEFVPLSEQTLAGVEKFVFFIGYPRSGHSVIASLMDSHPSIVIAHQYNVFGEWVKGNMSKKLQDKSFLFNELYKDSWYQATSGWRTAKSDVKGYSLHTESSWLGQYKNLKVIGDKDAALTSWTYYRYPDQFQDAFHSLKKSMGIPIRAIHVVRNPYDMIATHLLYKVSDRAGRRLKTATENNKYNNTRLLQIGAINVFREVNAVESMTKALNLDVLETHNIDLVRDPRGTMQKICDFLGVECSEDYLQLCQEKAFDKVSITRNLVYWSDELLADVKKRVKLHKFFDRYSFDSKF